MSLYNQFPFYFLSYPPLSSYHPLTITYIYTFIYVGNTPTTQSAVHKRIGVATGQVAMNSKHWEPAVLGWYKSDVTCRHYSGNAPSASPPPQTCLSYTCLAAPPAPGLHPAQHHGTSTAAAVLGCLMQWLLLATVSLLDAPAAEDAKHGLRRRQNI